MGIVFNRIKMPSSYHGPKLISSTRYLIAVKRELQNDVHSYHRDTTAKREVYDWPGLGYNWTT
jgi:hypothetical protein